MAGVDSEISAPLPLPSRAGPRPGVVVAACASPSSSILKGVGAETLTPSSSPCAPSSSPPSLFSLPSAPATRRLVRPEKPPSSPPPPSASEEVLAAVLDREGPVAFLETAIELVGRRSDFFMEAAKVRRVLARAEAEVAIALARVEAEVMGRGAAADWRLGGGIIADRNGDWVDASLPVGGAFMKTAAKGFEAGSEAVAFQSKLKKMCTEGAYWGTVAGVYLGMEYGMERVRGTHDWKNAMLGGALTGVVMSLATGKGNDRDKVVMDAITGGAAATAAEFLNYLM